MADQPLSAEEKKTLLAVARQTILDHLQKGKIEKVKPATEALAQQGGAFVSLHQHGTLRGCIGTFVSKHPIVVTVQEMAVSASQHDPRFDAVCADELGTIDIEISVLSPLRPIQDVAEIEVGKHGIYITRGYHSGVLLPQVATEYGWDRETFLDHTCVKAGLKPGAWREPGTRIEIFDAQVFGEKDSD
jgi:uncharacterized protein